MTDNDTLELDRGLTEVGDTFIHDGIAGLALADNIPEQDRPLYKPGVLRDWADALEDVQGQVEIGVAPAKTYSDNHNVDDDEEPLALYAVVPESGVVALACPWLGTPLHERGDDDE